MELGTRHATNVHFVIVFKQWHDLDPAHTDLQRGRGGKGGGGEGRGRQRAVVSHDAKNHMTQVKL